MLQIKNSFLIAFAGVCLLAGVSYAQNLPEEAQKKDPCPDVQTAISDSPDDLSKVQADIDRFTLCVERAQLLKRLNDLATENEEDLLGLSNSNPGFMLEGGQSFDTLPTFDKDAVINPENVTLPEEELSVPEEINDGWLILSINGAGRNLSARLGKKSGLLAQVKEGETLPDGSITVMISPVSVTITENGEKKDLSWFEETK